MRGGPSAGESAMPAQLASTIKWNGNYAFGSDVLTNMADHGAVVAAVIAGWSITETHLGRTFATLVGAKQPVAMSMYAAVRSFEVQRSLLQAAVNEALPERHAALFKAALVVVNRAAQYRHSFAHWVWGASADPSVVALLLVEPKNFWHLTAAQIKYWNNRRGRASIERAGPVAFAAAMPRLHHEHIWIYRLKDLQEARGHIERAFRIADALRQFVASKGPRRRAIYRWIKSEADIREALEKAKNSRQPTHSPRRARRPKSTKR
jgi:hypothetical protein